MATWTSSKEVITPVGLLRTTLHFLNLQLLRLSWVMLLAMLGLHFSLSWGLMYLSGEEELIAPGVWFYYFVTTATTVGYGDFSPVTTPGRIVASLLVMPGAVVIFAGFLGKLSSMFVSLWRKDMQGRGDYSRYENHIVILGWNPEHTPYMIELIFGDARRDERKVILCASTEMDNPYPDKIDFVWADDLNSPELQRRAAIHSADRIIIDRNGDDKTLASCLSVAATETRAHIVAWFERENMAELLKAHCPQVESQCSVGVEMLVRAAQDPGSSRVQHQLLSTLEGPTQFSVTTPQGFPGVGFGKLLELFKSRHEAIVLGVAETVTGDDLTLNPPSDFRVEAGYLVYYMSAVRIRSEEILWDSLWDSL
ncbi:MAG: potassium channel family protein [Endozoicomonas sp.]